LGSLPADEFQQADKAQPSFDAERIASIVIARIEDKREHHLHLPMEMPSLEQAVASEQSARSHRHPRGMIPHMVIDAHLHLWDIDRVRYEWLRRPENCAINRTFGFEDFRQRALAAGVDRAVMVQAADNATDTAAMFEIADAHEEIAGVVAWVPLDRPEQAAEQLDQLSARPKFAGIRNLIHDQPDPDWLLGSEVGEGLSLLESAGVPFDVISVLPRHLSHIPVLSARYPGLRMVIDHLSHPPIGRRDWEPWRTLITNAARNPLVFAKLSGLYPEGAEWDSEDIRPFAEFAVELFGADRLMFGSDWPVSELAGGYAKVWREVSKVLDQLSATERRAVLGNTARRVYAPDAELGREAGE
jgi:L-fuconolactonase